MISPDDLTQALIDHAVADLALGAGGILGPVLTTYGLAIDTSASEDDDGELVGLKFGDPDDPPDGVSIGFDPIEVPWTRDGTPDMARQDFLVLIRAVYKDYPGGALNGKRGKLSRFMKAMGFAMQRVFGPASLGAIDGTWTAAPGEALSLPDLPYADLAGEREIRDQVLPYVEVTFMGYQRFSSP